ncbi:hypothetical protein HHI36_013454 [Cryptolaemus montrouzieri]|uniref:Uncharacterized protein n=1 Tax=Cryptolaemus montrouzieri TaxID=559131 RepID=A0ABD2NHM4_9CUCU
MQHRKLKENRKNKWQIRPKGACCRSQTALRNQTSVLPKFDNDLNKCLVNFVAITNYGTGAAVADCGHTKTALGGIHHVNMCVIIVRGWSDYHCPHSDYNYRHVRII